jgi:hypothetical protein
MTSFGNHFNIYYSIVIYSDEYAVHCVASEHYIINCPWDIKYTRLNKNSDVTMKIDINRIKL